MDELIVRIDRLRLAYIEGMTKALSAHSSLIDLDNEFQTLQHTPALDALAEMQSLSAKIIWKLSQKSKGQVSIHVDGDMIQVGDVSGEVVAIGKDIEQQVNTDAS